MALHPCGVPLCEEMAMTGPADVYIACQSCGERLCGLHHYDPIHHKCARKSEETCMELEIVQGVILGNTVQNQLDLPTYLAEAMALRPGHSCKGPSELVREVMHCVCREKELTIFEGQYHWNLFITFDDEVKWVVRMSQKAHTNPPLPALYMTAASECTTLQMLSTAGIKVPHAWPSTSFKTRQLSHGNGAHTGQPYFFTEFVPGTFYEHFLGRAHRETAPSEVDMQHIRCLAEYFIGVSDLTFDSVGSLHADGDGLPHVGPVVTPFVMLSSPPWFLGPFPTARAFYLAYIDKALEQTLAGLYYCATGASDGYIILTVLRKLLEECPELEHGPWYVKAVDDKGDRYFFADGRLTGVIDWEWAFLTCKGEAFAAPRCLLSPDYYSGSNKLSEWELSLARSYDDLGRSDLAECVRKGKKFQRLRDLLEKNDQDIGRLLGLYRAFIEPEIDPDETEPETVSEWATHVKRRFPDLVISEEHLVILRFRAARATLLPGTVVPADSDVEDEEEESGVNGDRDTLSGDTSDTSIVSVDDALAI